MKFLKELMDLAASEQLDEAKKRKVGEPFVGMLPIKSFVAGNMVMHNRSDGDGDDEENGDTVDEGHDMKLKLVTLKPRNLKLHNVLSGRKGGKMKDKKKDYNRSDEKRKTNDE